MMCPTRREAREGGSTREALTVLVVLGIVALVVVVTAVAPPSGPTVLVGTLPLAEGFYTLDNRGTYYGPCGSGDLPIWWAVFVYSTNGTNASFRITGAWQASRPTSMEFGILANDIPVTAFQDWIVFLHCPLNPPATSPPLPPLSRSGAIDSNLSTQPNAHRLFVVFRSFEGADVLQIPQTLLVTPV